MNQTDYDLQKIVDEVLQAAKQGVDPNQWPWRNKIIHTDRMFGLWAVVCDECIQLEGDQISPELACLFLIERANGLRRMENIPESEVRDCLHSASELLKTSLVGHPRHNRLTALELCHRGRFLEMLGKYGDAAIVHSTAIQFAATGLEKAIAQYGADLALLKHAIVDPASCDAKLKQLWNQMVEDSLVLRDFYNQDPTDWLALKAYLNFVYNTYIYMWVVKGNLEDYPNVSLPSYLQLDLLVPREFKQAYVGSHRIINAMRTFHKSTRAVVENAQLVTPSQNWEEYGLARFFLVWALPLLGNHKESEEIRGELLEQPYGNKIAISLLNHYGI